MPSRRLALVREPSRLMTSTCSAVFIFLVDCLL